MNIPVKFTFRRWEKDGKPLVESPDDLTNLDKQTDLETGNFSFGSLFTGTIELDEMEYEELKKSVLEGYEPVVQVVVITKDIPK
jgi:hypothetical protein